MAYHPCLSANHYVSANFCRAANARLCCNYGIGTYFYIVCNLYQVVNFCTAPYNGTANCSAVNGGVGAYFYLVFYHHIANLRYFLKTAIGLRGKAKTICANYRTAMDYTIFTNTTLVVDSYPGMQDGAVTNSHIIAYKYLRVNFYTVTNFGLLADVGKSADKYAVANNGRFVYKAWLLTTFQLLQLQLLVFGKQLGKGIVRICYAYQRCINFLP